MSNHLASVDNLNSSTRKGSSSSAAKRLMAAGGNPEALRTNATLLYDEWKLFDRTVMQIGRERLVIAGELMRRGLTYPIPNALGVIQLLWQRVGDLNPAEMTMTGLPEADKDQLDNDLVSMPIPMIHKEFQLDLRQLEATRRGGMPLDMAQAEIATRKIAEMVDSIIFAGSTIAANLGSIYGILTHPNRVTGSVTANWLTATGSQIVTDLITMSTALTAKNMFGPYTVFVPTGTFMHMGDDYKANSDKTIISRILEMPNIEAIIPTNRLTGSNVVMIQMTSDVIQLIDGIQPVMVEWEERGGFELNFMIYCIMLPRIRADFAAQSGIAHYS